MNSPIPSKDLQGGNVSRDAMQLIKADRKKLESLFKQYEKTSAGDLEARERLVSEMTQQVSKIVSLKAQTVYPPMQAKLSRRGREMVLQAVEQQQIAKRMLGELSKMRPQDARFNAKVHVLMENLRQHLKFEESKLSQPPSAPPPRSARPGRSARPSRRRASPPAPGLPPSR